MKYSVCTDALFHGMDPGTVLPQVKDCGFDAMEFWTWWDKDIPELARICRDLEMKVVTFCVDFRNNPGDSAQHDAYLDGLKRSIEAAKALNCSTLIAQAGWAMDGISFEAHDAALTQVMEDAVPILKNSNMELVVEPLNVKVDHPGYHMSTSVHAFSWLQGIGDPHVKILFDLYHQQITEGNLTGTVTRHIDSIGHFHIAAVPGRVEPTRGEVNYPFVLKAIDALGYQGYLGLEYMPKTDPIATLRAVRQAFPR